MATHKFVSAMGERRRSAFELRGAMTTTANSSSGSVASQLLALYRRSSLQDDARKQHDVLLQLTKPRRAPQDDEAEPTDQGKCSHRSSISTVNEEDESVLAATLAAVALHEEEQAAETETPIKPLLETNDEDNDEVLVDLDDALAVEALDCLMPLPSEDARVFCDVDQCPPRPSEEAVAPTQVPSVPAPTPVPGPATLVPRRRKVGTVLREHPQQELYLFREEAEYSDYVDARLTGVHTEVDGVVYYQLDVHLSQMKWQVLRRFSEFHALRQRLLAHLARRQRFQSPQCKICADILQTLEQAPFPSRRAVRPARWHKLLLGGRRAASHSPGVLTDRKRKLQGFVTTCVLTVRGLRQHSRLMCDSSACEISVALRMIEEFLGLSFTRYMRFLNERGVLDTDEDGRPLGTDKDERHTMGRRRVRLPADSDAPRRATMAV